MRPFSFGMLGDASRHSQHFAPAWCWGCGYILDPFPGEWSGGEVVRDGLLWDGHNLVENARRSMAGYSAREDARSYSEMKISALQYWPATMFSIFGHL